MPITLVKLVDLYVGTLVFALLNLVDLAATPFRRRRVGDPQRILLVKFWGLGSILLLQPTVRALRRRFPGAHVTLLTLRRNLGLAPLLPGIDALETLSLERPLSLPFRIVALALRLRRRRYDLVIDCEFFAKLAAILTYLSWAPERIGFYRRERLRRRLYTKGVPFLHDRHVTAAFAELCTPLGIEVDPGDHALAGPAPAARAEARSLLERLAVESDFVAVNVNASELAYERRWAPEKFADLCRRIAGEIGLDVLLVGAGTEAAYVEAVRHAAGSARVHNVAGTTTLPGLQALLLRARLFVSNDSGPLHLAAASGVRCVALFGPETPDLYGPVGDGHIVFYRRLSCSPCMSVHDMKQVVCGGQIDCLREISVDQVLGGVKQLVGNRVAAAVGAR